MALDWSHPDIRETIERALAEDIGDGDITSEACVPAERMAEGSFYAREPLIVAAIECLPLIFPLEELQIEKQSGDRAVEGQRLAHVRGTARRLLERERTALNLLQRLCGIATVASRYVQEIAGTQCRILDTRKTTPGLRRLEKMAAAAGGVHNHRMGLYDAILIKNNHIAAAEGITAALKAALATGRAVEIEVRNRDEIIEALDAGATHLLLDNLSPADAVKAIRFIAGRAVVELSGGITLETVRAYAETGAEFVSCGAITHSAAAVDINFRLTLI
jgi:nicotinate-nucleotide pyrophosphorylase (carboxylating)